MDNFQISYNYLNNAFERKKVPFPKELATILAPISTTSTTTQSPNDNNTSNVDNDDEQDNMDEHNLDDSSSSNYSEEYDYSLASVNVAQLSTEASQGNILDNTNDVQSRRELYKELYQLVLTKRKQKGLTNKNNETYEWPPIVKQIIRCRYPADVRDCACYKQVTVSFTLDSFIDLFADS